VTAYLIALTACLVLGIGHIGWGIAHPFKALAESNAPSIVAASLHACWYHISIIFIMTAGFQIWHLAVTPVSLGILSVMWALIFLCYLTYWGALLYFPENWPAAWGQMVIIPILLGSFAYGIWSDYG